MQLTQGQRWNLQEIRTRPSFFKLFSLHAITKKINSKMKALEWSQAFPNCNAMEGICCHVNQGSIFYDDIVYTFIRNSGKHNISDQF